MSKWLVVCVLVLLVLVSAVGVRNLTTVASTGGLPMPPTPYVMATGGLPMPPTPYVMATGGLPMPPTPYNR
jgi:hypothetical protein